MRLEEPFVYEITAPRPIPAIFRFLMEAGPVAPREAYATFNMGIGFAVYVAPGAAQAALEAARASGYDAWIAGRVRADGGRKAVLDPVARPGVRGGHAAGEVIPPVCGVTGEWQTGGGPGNSGDRLRFGVAIAMVPMSPWGRLYPG
jgi:hypothetical protein